jgi:hypothetical protein
MMRQATLKGQYLSYLLRLWETTDGERRVWRATLESPLSGERRSFASLDELFAFLTDATAAEAPISEPG